ncbi:hypothetical protein VNO78_21466 [Psophocarpus tetragonolobus]|uniref:Uncharacterized protein n=1 Tax=Psophocarpus tetragonolobus TaxID=3891 RepID=A0AAN9SCE2_PSOTE
MLTGSHRTSSGRRRLLLTLSSPFAPVEVAPAHIIIVLSLASPSSFRSIRGHLSACFKVTPARIEVKLHFCMFVSRSRLKLVSAFLTVFALTFL